MVGVARIELATPAMSMRCEAPDSILLFSKLAVTIGALAQYRSLIGRGSFNSDSHFGSHSVNGLGLATATDGERRNAGKRGYLSPPVTGFA